MWSMWSNEPPPEEGDPSLCSQCGKWAEWEEHQCPLCGYGEPPEPADEAAATSRDAAGMK